MIVSSLPVDAGFQDGTRNYYPEEEIMRAIDMVRVHGLKPSQVSRRLGINRLTLKTWLALYDSNGNRPPPACKRHTPEEKLLAVKMVRYQGMTMDSVCEKMGIGRTALRSWLNNHDTGGDAIAKIRKSHTAEEKYRAVMMVREGGMLQREVCYLLGVRFGVLKNWLYQYDRMRKSAESG